MTITRIGYSAANDVFVISDQAVYPARSLTVALDSDMIEITSLADRVELRAPWTNLRRLDGSAFNDANDALAWAQQQSQQGTSTDDVTDLLAFYILAKT